MIEDWHISLIKMMENAGRNLAELFRWLLVDSLSEKWILVLYGNGINGGSKTPSQLAGTGISLFNRFYRTIKASS